MCAAGKWLRISFISTAQTVQYEATNEPARQLGLADVRPEPFTARQQRQSRMDGGEEEDGSLRDAVAVSPLLLYMRLRRIECQRWAQRHSETFR